MFLHPPSPDFFSIMMMVKPGNYRARLLLDLCQVVVLPVLVLLVLTRIYETHLWWPVPTYILFIALWVMAKGLIKDILQSQERYRLGAKAIPCVVGKWPGNIDVLLRMMRAFKTSYLMDVYLELFEEYQCTTLNLRILWRDSVGYMSPCRNCVLTKACSRSLLWIKNTWNLYLLQVSIIFGGGIIRRNACQSFVSRCVGVLLNHQQGAIPWSRNF